MKPLSPTQAATCETAKHPTCRCRCGGAFHGAARISRERELLTEREVREEFSRLGEQDPHYVPAKSGYTLRREAGIRRRHERHHAAYPEIHAGPRATLIRDVGRATLRRCRACIALGYAVPAEKAHADEEDRDVAASG